MTWPPYVVTFDHCGLCRRVCRAFMPLEVYLAGEPTRCPHCGEAASIPFGAAHLIADGHPLVAEQAVQDEATLAARKTMLTAAAAASTIHN